MLESLSTVTSLQQREQIEKEIKLPNTERNKEGEMSTGANVGVKKLKRQHTWGNRLPWEQGKW